MKRKAKRIVNNFSAAVRKPSKSMYSKGDGFGHSIPPDFDLVAIYFDQKGLGNVAELFFLEQATLRWETPTGGIIRNWKVCAAEWIYNYRQDLKRQFKKSPFYTSCF